MRVVVLIPWRFRYFPCLWPGDLKSILFIIEYSFHFAQPPTLLWIEWERQSVRITKITTAVHITTNLSQNSVDISCNTNKYQNLNKIYICQEWYQGGLILRSEIRLDKNIQIFHPRRHQRSDTWEIKDQRSYPRKKPEILGPKISDLSETWGLLFHPNIS